MGPRDVVALVESGLELHQDRNLLLCFGSLDQKVDQQRRVRPDPIERDLDRDHLRVVDRGPQERLDRRERVEWVVHQVITVGDLVEDRVDVSLGPEPPRRERRVLELGVMQAGQAEPVAVPHPLRHALDDVLRDLEVLDQDVEHP